MKMKESEKMGKLDLLLINNIPEYPGAKVYKCRAECYKDVKRFIKIAYPNLKEWNCKPWYFDSGNLMPDIDFTFITDLNIDIMKSILNGLEDCHVMSETLELYENYTGER
jgi:hypothetical protein